MGRGPVDLLSALLPISFSCSGWQALAVFRSAVFPCILAPGALSSDKSKAKILSKLIVLMDVYLVVAIASLRRFLAAGYQTFEGRVHLTSIWTIDIAALCLLTKDFKETYILG